MSRPAKRGLGRGLGALLRTGDGPGGIVEIGVDQVVENPHQPRSVSDPASTEELSESIREAWCASAFASYSGRIGRSGKASLPADRRRASLEVSAESWAGAGARYGEGGHAGRDPVPGTGREHPGGRT